MSLFDEYKKHGWALCDIPPGTKGPTVKGWNQLNYVAHGRQGVGLCHAWSGTCTLDIDNYPVAFDWFKAQGVDLDLLLARADSVQIVSGRPNRAKLLFRLNTPIASIGVAPYKAISKKSGKEEVFHAAELRCATKNGLSVQDVLPPTIHPETGKPYQWAYGDDLVGHWSTLPDLPEKVLGIWMAQLGDQTPVQQDSEAAPATSRGMSTEALQALLEKHPAEECAYDDWLKVGQALHHETGGKGYQLWLSWSAKSRKHDASQMPAKWRSFGGDHIKNPVTIGALLSSVVASPDEFETVDNTDVGEDQRPEAKIKALLEDRLVFVRAHEMYFDIRSNGEGLMGVIGLRHEFCPHMPYIEVPQKKGKPKLIKPDPYTWLQNSATKRMVDAVGMHPGAGRLFSEDGCAYVNKYVPLVVEEVAPNAYEQEAFNFLWSRIADPTMASWLMKFYAFCLQRPGIKVQAAPLLVSKATGTGKNTLMKVLPEILFGSRYVRTMSGSVLGGQFNATVGNTWWLYLEELRAGVHRSDRTATTNRIKSWVTDNTIEVHKKGKDPYDIRNRIQLTATSNFDDALQLDNEDRRWAIGEMRDSLTHRESMDLYDYLLSERAAGTLRYIFRHVDVTGFKPTGRAPDTAMKRTMVRAGVSNWESKLIEGIVERTAPFDRDIFKLPDVRDFMMGSGATDHQLSSTLRSEPFCAVPLAKCRNHRLWAWRNVALWQKCTEGERIAYMSTGTRPAGHPWRDEIPKKIRDLSTDGGLGVDSAEGLL